MSAGPPQKCAIEELHKKGPLSSPKHKVVGSVAATLTKGQLYLTLSIRTLWNAYHLYFSHLCLHLIPQLSMNLLFQIFFPPSSLQIEGLLSFYHSDGNLPTTESETFSSLNNLLLSWAELFYRALHEKSHTCFANFSNYLHTQPMCLSLFSTYFWPRCETEEPQLVLKWQ